MINLTEKGMKNFISKLKKQNKLWEKNQSKTTLYYSVAEKGRFYVGDTNKGGLSVRELSLINMTKIELKKFAKADIIEKDFTKIDYFNAFSPNLKDERMYFEDCIQIDINSAYLTILKNSNAITDKLFNSFFEVEKKMSDRKAAFKQNNKDYKSRCGGILKISKKCRLIAVGSIATEKIKTSYKGTEQIKEPELIYNQKEANIFFWAAYLVGQVMKEIMTECSGLFYWVDCVFLPESEKEKALKIFKNNNLENHFDQCIISFTRNRHNVHFQVVNKNDGDINDYFFRHTKCIDLEKYICDYSKILDIYNSEAIEMKITEIAKEAKKIGLQTLDILYIKSKFVQLEGMTGTKILHSIIIALKNDFGIIFETE